MSVEKPWTSAFSTTLNVRSPQIAALSGHDIDYCQRIIDTYLPRRTEVALGAIKLWEDAPDRDTVVMPIKR